MVDVAVASHLHLVVLEHHTGAWVDPLHVPHEPLQLLPGVPRGPAQVINLHYDLLILIPGQILGYVNVTSFQHGSLS